MAKVLRILHLGKHFPPYAGGMETFLGDLSSAQARMGHEMACLVHGTRSGVGERAGIALYTAKSFGQLLYMPISPAYPVMLRKALADFKPQLLHIHMPNASTFWAMASRRARALPWVVHWQSDIVMDEWPRWQRLGYAAYRLPERALLRQAGAVVATSPGYLAHSRPLRRWRAKAHIIPLGVDPERLQPCCQPQFSWPSNAELRLLLVGRLSHYKGHHVLLKALQRCTGVNALIVGGGERGGVLREQAKRLGLEKRVTFTGVLPQSEVNWLMARCDVLCLPSTARSESVGVVLLEAMALGKPVIASDLPGSGMPWVVETGGHGLLAGPNNPASLAGALEQMKDSGLRGELGRRGRQSFEENFHINRVAARLQSLYTDVI